MRKSWGISLLLIIMLLVVSGCSDTEDEQATEQIGEMFDWENIVLSGMLPEPPSNLFEIIKNSEQELYINVYDMTENDYYGYIHECKDAGYTTVTCDEGEFTAYNEGGYCINLQYFDYSVLENPNYMCLELNTPVEMEEQELLPEKQTTVLDSSNTNNTDENVKSDMDRPSVETVDTAVSNCNVEFLFLPIDNFMYSDYDVNIYIDGKIIGTMKESSELKITKEVKQGNHTVYFEKAEDSDIKKSIEIEISQDTTLKFVLYRSSEIFVDYYKPLEEGKTRAPEDSTYLESYDYTELKIILEEAGFSNVSYEIIYDLKNNVWGSASLYDIESVSINGITDFRAVDIFNADDSVVITYHDYEMNNPDIEYKSYTTKQLYEDLSDNPARAEKNHKDEYVIVTGVIAEISKSGDVFTISDSSYAWTFDGISCSINSEDLEEKLLDFSVGDKIQVKGKIKGVDVIFPYLIDVYDFK